MKKLFDLHGIGLSIEGDSELVSRIAEDFAYFERAELSRPARIVFEILPPGGKAIPVLTPAFRTKMCDVFGWGRERVCDYGSGTRVYSRIEKGCRLFSVIVGDPELTYEALYSAVLSSVGEELDRRGFHRVHALGIEHGGKRALVLLPIGGGKSAIAALLHRDPGVKIFSDESPLIQGDRIFPFPVRGALRPEVASALGVSGVRVFKRKLYPEKLLIPFDRERIAEQARLDWILVGLVGREEAQVRASLFAKFAAFLVLLDICVLGRGLAQMSEYMIRGDSLWNLPRIALRRFFTAFWLTFGSGGGWMKVTADARQNAKALSEFLR